MLSGSSHASTRLIPSFKLLFLEERVIMTNYYILRVNHLQLRYSYLDVIVKLDKIKRKFH